ncbi:MAG: SMP-30/gluconolactonase/LRE family protein, partial [Alphaproteobacteria bacterium]|nr:SMP-30/gluconolactonase/LRE family protein [Alphaproteobacteria bacterium]
MHIDRVGSTRDKLGEGPVWDGRGNALFWIDSISRTVHRLDAASGDVWSWGVPGMIGSLCLCEDGTLIVALETGFHRLDLRTGRTELIFDPEADEPRTRFNDGKTDRQGRFVAGTMVTRKEDRQKPLGALYRLDADLSVHVLDEGIMLSNGPCFSPDGETLYFSDSTTGLIYAYDYDPDTGDATNRRVHIDVGALNEGAGDGATVDADGNLWVALIRSSEIGVFDPAGKLQDTFKMPVALPSSVMFGGETLDELYVTSISDSLNRQAAGEWDGALLKITGLGAKG